ncbi:MAG: sodium:proton antiporter, partial [Alphaproteobacteria bacterium]|nr:sodium:proton antiporter [Alphaproteobacteria bacterium]
MSSILDLCFNASLVSVFLLCFLCVKKVNVLLAIITSAMVAGLVAGLDVKHIMNTFISGMGENSETALSYILLGTFAATMAHSGFTDVLSSKITEVVSGKKYMLLGVLTLMSMASQNIVPIHIAFIPIVIPSLLKIMNNMRIDRRAVACVLAFGLKMPYIAIPAGFGLIFQNLIADNLVQNGVYVVRNDIWKYAIILGFGMIVGLLIAIFVSYRKSRKYEDKSVNVFKKSDKFSSKHRIVVLAALATFAVQLITKSLPLGALVGLGIMFSCRVIPQSKMDQMMNEGIYLMGYIAFVMLVAAGFADVLKETGSIEKLVDCVLPLLPDNIYMTSLAILLIGLFITIGIGTSFGTVPILAVLFVPICVKTGFSTPQMVVLLTAASALGD